MRIRIQPKISMRIDADLDPGIFIINYKYIDILPSFTVQGELHASIFEKTCEIREFP